MEFLENHENLFICLLIYLFIYLFIYFLYYMKWWIDFLERLTDEIALTVSCIMLKIDQT